MTAKKMKKNNIVYKRKYKKIIKYCLKNVAWVFNTLSNSHTLVWLHLFFTHQQVWMNKKKAPSFSFGIRHTEYMAICSDTPVPNTWLARLAEGMDVQVKISSVTTLTIIY